MRRPAIGELGRHADPELPGIAVSGAGVGAGPNIVSQREASLSRAVGASVPAKRGSMPSRLPMRTASSRIDAAGRPVTFRINGGVSQCSRARRAIA